MKKQKGVTLIALTITIVVMMILAGITISVGTDLIKQAKLQDLRTNMLLIQAKAKESLEEVAFQTANMDPSTDIDKINDIKSENYKGQPLSGSVAESEATATNKIDTDNIGDYYYLEPQDLKEMGIEDLPTGDYGYFIVRYNLADIKVEVINTNGFKGNYTLEELNKLSEETI